MKNLAFVMALLIVGIAAVGILVPSSFAWIAQHSVTAGAFYVAAAVRVALGLLLISVAPNSRAPKTLRVLGCLLMVAGIATAVTGLVAIERARAIIETWAQQGPGALRFMGVLVLAFGAFVAYTCAPARRAA